MATEISEQKAALRKAMLERLKTQPPDARNRKSKAIAMQLAIDSCFGRAKAVMFYVATSVEVETLSLMLVALQNGKQVAVPFVNRRKHEMEAVQIYDPVRDLRPGSFGIREPKPDLIKSFDTKRLDLVVTPGLAFDSQGHRLGRGEGYYDRFLSRLPNHVKRYGIGFDFQLVDAVPVENRDITLDLVITNR